MMSPKRKRVSAEDVAKLREETRLSDVELEISRCKPGEAESLIEDRNDLLGRDEDAGPAAADVSTADLISMVQAGTPEEKAKLVKRLMKDTPPWPDGATRTPSLEQMQEGIEATASATFMADLATVDWDAAYDGTEDEYDLACATKALGDHEASGEKAIKWEDVKKQLDLDDGEFASPEIDAAWRAEIARRLETVKSGDVDLLPLDDVRARLKAKLVPFDEAIARLKQPRVTAHNVTMSYRYRPAVSLTFTIPGPPVPKARARASKSGHHFTPTRTRVYEALVRTHATASVQRSQWRPLPGSKFVVTIHVFRARKSGDLDNFVKSITDACNKLIWSDDRDIAELHGYLGDDRKRPRVEVSVSLLRQEVAA